MTEIEKMMVELKPMVQQIMAAAISQAVEDKQAEIDHLKHHLSNLLARIHRDGGHHEQEVGTDKAVKDADSVIANFLAGADEIDRLKAELEAEKHINDIGRRAHNDDRGYAHCVHLHAFFDVVLNINL